LQQALFGERLQYRIKSSPFNQTVFGSGKLVGGNLSMVHAAAGSKSDISTRGKILFLEDVSEYKYSIDRMMMSLKRSGKLDSLAGLVVGGLLQQNMIQKKHSTFRLKRSFTIK
jgi:muramoyltetrapeptide carboxypeptidase